MSRLLADLFERMDSPPAGGHPDRPALVAVAPAPPAPAPTPPPAPQRAPDGEQLGFVLTAATATPEWIAARDRFHAHALGGCRACHAPVSRYCQTGAELRATYNATPWS